MCQGGRLELIALDDKEKGAKEQVVGGGLHDREFSVHLTDKQAAARASKELGQTEQQARSAAAEKEERDKTLQAENKAWYRPGQIPKFSSPAEKAEKERVQKERAEEKALLGQLASPERDRAMRANQAARGSARQASRLQRPA